MLKRIAWASVSLLLLTACGGIKAEAPKDVIQKFKEAATKIEAADFAVDATMVTPDGKDSMNVKMGLQAKIDRREGMDRKADLRIKLDGTLVAAGKTLSGALDFGLLTLGENFYFNVMKLDSSDPAMATYKQVIEKYQGKWQHIPSDFIPESMKKFQEKDEKAIERSDKLKALFVSTDLFEVNKEFGVESLDGKKVYHYGVKLSEAGLRDYVRKAAQVDGRELSEAEVEQSAELAKALTNCELWIGMKDYLLYKGSLALSGQNPEGGLKSDMKMSFIGNGYNKELGIAAPENPSEFNPISLMMELQLLNPPAEKTEGETTAVEETPAPAAEPSAEKAK